MSLNQIHRICSSCGGTGNESGTSIDEHGDPQDYDNICHSCQGEGIFPNLELNKDLIDLLQDMNDKINDIFEKLNEV